MDTAGRRYCWTRRAELALAKDEASLALNIADRLIDSAAGLREGDVISFLWLVKGQALASLGRLEEARELLVDGRNHTMETQERFLLWRFQAALARLCQTTGDSTAVEEWPTVSCIIEEMAATVTDEALGASFRSRAIAILQDVR